MTTSGPTGLLPEYGNLLAWATLMTVITYGAITESRLTVLLAMGGWVVFCLVIHLFKVDRLRRPHRQRLRDALKKKREDDARPRYYEEPDHFFW